MVATRVRSPGRITPNQQQRLAQKRRDLCVEFPIGTIAIWYEENLGPVTGHNLKRGRVRFGNGHDYDPKELTIVQSDDQKK